MSREAQKRSAQQEDRYAEARAGADAQHVWSGQRIAEEGLHLQAAHGEGGAGQQSDYGFQQADVQDNLRCDGVVSAARQCGEDFADRDGYGSDREIDDEKYRRQNSEQEKEDALPSLHRFSSVFGNRSVRHPSIPGGRCGSDLAESGPGV